MTIKITGNFVIISIFNFFICMDSYEKASQEKVELELRIKEAELREAALSAKVSSRIE